MWRFWHWLKNERGDAIPQALIWTLVFTLGAVAVVIALRTAVGTKYRQGQDVVIQQSQQGF